MGSSDTREFLIDNNDSQHIPDFNETNLKTLSIGLTNYLSRAGLYVTSFQLMNRVLNVILGDKYCIFSTKPANTKEFQLLIIFDLDTNTVDTTKSFRRLRIASSLDTLETIKKSIIEINASLNYLLTHFMGKENPKFVPSDNIIGNKSDETQEKSSEKNLTSNNSVTTTDKPIDLNKICISRFTETVKLEHFRAYIPKNVVDKVEKEGDNYSWQNSYCKLFNTGGRKIQHIKFENNCVSPHTLRQENGKYLLIINTNLMFNTSMLANTCVEIDQTLIDDIYFALMKLQQWFNEKLKKSELEKKKLASAQKEYEDSLEKEKKIDPKLSFDEKEKLRQKNTLELLIKGGFSVME